MAVKLLVFLLFLYSVVICMPEENCFVPKLYELEDPNTCNHMNGVFCKISIILSPYNTTNTSISWKIIEGFNRDYHRFRHDKLQQGRCFKKYKIERLDKILRKDYASRFQNYSLKGDIENITCFENEHLVWNDIDMWDISAILLATFYGMFLVSVTAYSYYVHYNKKTPIFKFLAIFSIKSNWQYMLRPRINDDFQNLKSIQGIRTITTMLIISSHAFYGNLLGFMKNPEYIENIYINPITRTIVTIFTFLVQNFFLISAWLLTIQLNHISRMKGDLTFRDIMLLGINRYFRLIPVVAILVVVVRTNLSYDLISYMNEDILKREVEICRNYWWKNFLFIQNIYEPDMICSSITWYLAVDYQLYILTLGLFYVSHKMRINIKYFVSLIIIISILIQVVTMMNTGFQGFLRLTPKTANFEDVLVSKAYTISYIAPWYNSITFMMGISFGMIYCNHKEVKIFSNDIKKLLWYAAFFGLPIFAIFVTSFQYDNRFHEIVISVLARPLYSLGIGIGILGMASNYGGAVKTFCESRILVFLANFSYCVYLFHYPLVFLRILREEKLVELSISYIAKYTLIDYTLSFMCGALIHILVENPFIQLQKMVIPQVLTRKQNCEERTPPRTIARNQFSSKM